MGILLGVRCSGAIALFCMAGACGLEPGKPANSAGATSHGVWLQKPISEGPTARNCYWGLGKVPRRIMATYLKP